MDDASIQTIVDSLVQGVAINIFLASGFFKKRERRLNQVSEFVNLWRLNQVSFVHKTPSKNSWIEQKQTEKEGGL